MNSSSHKARTILASALTFAVIALAACSPSGETAPAFSLPDAAGRQVELSQLVQDNDAVVLVFYRGFF